MEANQQNKEKLTQMALPPSVHPSIHLLPLIQGRIVAADLLLPGHLLQVIWGNVKALLRQPRDLIFSTCLGPGASSQWDKAGTPYQGGI